MAYIVYGDKYVLTSGKLTVNASSEGDLILTFTTDDVGGTSFDPTFTVSSGTLKWDLGDGSIVHANSFTHVYSMEGNKTVKVYDGSTSGAGSIRSVYMPDDNIVGSLDLSSFSSLDSFTVNDNPKLTSILNPVSSGSFSAYRAHDCSLNGILDLSGLSGLGGQFNIQKNYNITEIINPVSSQTFSMYWADRNNLTGTLDVSGLTGLGGQFAVYSNPNLTKILNPVSSQNFSMYWAFDCDLSGTLDVSGLTGLGGSFYVNDNPNLTQILNPTSSTTFTYYYAYDCSLNGTLNVSGLTGLGGTFYVHRNSNLSDILLPDISTNFTVFNAGDCSLSLTTVDDIFSKFNTYYTANAPTAALTIDVGGGTNSPPTDGSSNTNIQSLESIFDTATQTLTITINTL